MKQILKKYLIICIPILFMILIILFSTQTGKQSTGLSKDIARAIVGESSPLFSFVHGLIRKSAHFTEYFTLSLITYFSIGIFKLDQSKRLLYTIIAAASFASLDEIVQRFVPGRESKFTDVLIDTLGALTGILVIRAIKSLQKQKGDNTAKM